MREGLDVVAHVKGSLQPVEPKKQQQETDEEYGVIILPPIMGETNEEVSGYPEDYVEYSLNRMKMYKEAHGALPEWKREGEDEAEA